MKRKDLYVCGYIGSKECIYGDENEVSVSNKSNWIQPMTLFQAKKYVKSINKAYELTKSQEQMKVFKLIIIK